MKKTSASQFTASLQQDMAFGSKLGVHITAGVTDPIVRRERVRSAILSFGMTDAMFDATETFAQAFLRVYHQELIDEDKDSGR
jgi:hypothetical protein